MQVIVCVLCYMYIKRYIELQRIGGVDGLNT